METVCLRSFLGGFVLLFFRVSKLPLGVTFQEIQRLNHAHMDVVLKEILDFPISVNQY